jgi:hypothetical protein
VAAVRTIVDAQDPSPATDYGWLWALVHALNSPALILSVAFLGWGVVAVVTVGRLATLPQFRDSGRDEYGIVQGL